MKNNQPIYKIIYLWLDIIIITISFLTSVTITIPNFWSIQKHMFDYYYSYLSLLIVLTIIHILIFYYNQLYARNIILSLYYQFILLIKALIIACLLCIFLMAIYNVNFLAWRGKQLFLTLLFTNILTITFFRIVIAKKIFITLSKRNIIKRKILIIGGDKPGKQVYKSLQTDPIKDFLIIGFLDDYKPIGAKIIYDYTNLGKIENIKKVVYENKIDEIIIAIDNMQYKRMIYLVEKCLGTSKVVRVYSNFLKVINEKLQIEKYSNIPVVKLSQYPVNDFTWKIKKIYDKILASILIIFLFPLLMIISLGIKFSSKGPIIYKQIRIGKNGMPFTFYKFRTMHPNQNDEKHKEFVRNVWFQKGKNKHNNVKLYRIENDHRVFNFGKFLRKTSLDELPQLFNVLKGDMSLVGPRPCMSFEWEMYEEWHKDRLDILPGCTGLWQAFGRATVSFDEMVILDLYYKSNMTILFDLEIIFKTIPVIFLGKGGH